MTIKDGGAMMCVDQGTNSGAELSRLILELLLMIFQQIRDANDESDTRAELLREMVDIKNQLDMIYQINKFSADLDPVEERILTPAEKAFGVQSSTKENKPNSQNLDNTNDYSPF